MSATLAFPRPLARERRAVVRPAVGTGLEVQLTDISKRFGDRLV
jgi:hypothetical protein